MGPWKIIRNIGAHRPYNQNPLESLGELQILGADPRLSMSRSLGRDLGDVQV